MIVPVDPETDLVVALRGDPGFAAHLCRIAFVANPVHRSIVPLLLDVDVAPEVQVHRAASVHHVAQWERVPHLRDRVPIAQRGWTVRNGCN